MFVILLQCIYLTVTVSLITYFLFGSIKKKRGLSKEILWWILFGFIFNGLSFTWLYTVYPLAWMPSGFMQLFGIGLLHLILSILSGLCFFVVGWVLYERNKIMQPYMPLAIATAFTLAEVLRSLALSLLYYGNKTTVDLHFNSGTIGNALSITPFVQFAYWGGTFALTFFLTYCISSFFFLTKRELIAHTAAWGTLLLFTHFLIPVKGPSRDITIGVITTDIKGNNNDSMYKKELQKTNEQAAELILSGKKNDIIVFPEDARFLSTTPEPLKEAVLSKGEGALLIDGDSVLYNGGVANISIFADDKTKVTSWRGKEFLLPFSEYVPYFFRAIIRPFFGNGLSEYEKKHTYTPLESGKVAIYDDLRIGTLICSEMLSYRMLSKLKAEDPDIVFYQSRLDVFNQNPLFYMHMRSFVAIAAAQMRTPIISSINGAPSYIISGKGQVVHEIKTSLSYTELFIKKGGKEKGGLVILSDR